MDEKRDDEKAKHSFSSKIKFGNLNLLHFAFTNEESTLNFQCWEQFTVSAAGVVNAGRIPTSR